MARSVAWRRTVTDAASWHQDEASNATIYILRETGPTGFLLKEDGEHRNFKVFVGDPHSCTCSVFKKEKDLCKHICWVILKKFRVSRQNPLSWQLGLVEREINDLLKGITAKQEVKPSAAAKRIAAELDEMKDESGNSSEINTVPQRHISNDDVCPICQEELLSRHQPVTFCRFSCGNNVHIKCMKVWAEHQKSTGKSFIECPFCREDFGPLSHLQTEYKNSSGIDLQAERLHEHPGIICQSCHVMPVCGKCYKCLVCSGVYLCQVCFNSDFHSEHDFQYRMKTSQKWRTVPSRASGVLPSAVITNLLSREISEQDYDLLLQLDNLSAQQPSSLTEESIHSFPIERVRQNSILLARGQQCCVCLRGYIEGEHVRRLPCRHRFHKQCIDDWLLHHHPTCPVDGAVYSNESIRQMKEAEKLKKQGLKQTKSFCDKDLQRNLSLNGVYRDKLNLEVPGIGLLRKPNLHNNGGDHVNETSIIQPFANYNHSQFRRNVGIEREMMVVQDGHAGRPIPMNDKPSSHSSEIMLQSNDQNSNDTSQSETNSAQVDLSARRNNTPISSNVTVHDANGWLHQRLHSIRDVTVQRRRTLYRNSLIPNLPNVARNDVIAFGNAPCTAGDILSLLSTKSKSTPSGHMLLSPICHDATTSNVKVPVPISIPLPRQMTDSHLEVTGNTHGNTVLGTRSSKPPTGYCRSAGSSKTQFRGRLRLKPLFHNSMKQDTDGNQRKLSENIKRSEIENDQRSLYVGNEPTMPSQLTSEMFVMSAQQQKSIVPFASQRSLYRHRSNSLQDIAITGSNIRDNLNDQIPDPTPGSS